METLRIGRDYTATWTVTLRDTNGNAITGVYTGSEPLDLAVDNLDGTAATLTSSSVAWLSATAGTVTLKLDEADTDLMSAGPRGLSIGVTAGGKRYEGYRATLRVEPRPH